MRYYSTMCLTRCLIVIAFVPVLLSSAQWTGNWFPVNPLLRSSTTEIPSSSTEITSSTTESKPSSTEPSSSTTGSSSSTPGSSSSTTGSSSSTTESTSSTTGSSSSTTESTSSTTESTSSTAESTSSTTHSTTSTIEFNSSSIIPLIVSSSSTTETSSTSADVPSTSSTTLSSDIKDVTELDIENWTGLWFPTEPARNVTVTPRPATPEPSLTMAEPNVACDNAKDNLGIDFDPRNIVDSVVYVCFGDKHLYNPNTSYEAILRAHVISPAYRPQHKCMDTAIKYSPGIPTYGDHRPLWAKYGEYKYVPPQRWLHNIEHGAIVMLYHPCANFNQVEQLKLLVKYCLYRHVITPTSTLLTPERPLALVAWGKSLEMSVVVPEMVVKFIKENALKGPEQILDNGQYEKLIINHADIVSTADDSVLCPNNAEIPII